MSRELVVRRGALAAPDAMRASRTALDRVLEGDAELAVVEITSEATVLGAFQRRHDAPDDPPQEVRGSGGPFVRVGPGTLHVLLALSHPAALVPCDARRIVNRHVRPLLRALTKRGALAHYFGRDWVSVGHRPIAEVGFAHDSETGRAVFEAFVAVGYDFAPSGRPSFLGKEPGTLESVTGLRFDTPALAGAIVAAYTTAADRVAVTRGAPQLVGVHAADLPDDPPWTATVDEAIGSIGAGRDSSGALRIGGDLLASRDALHRVATLVDALPPGRGIEEVGAIVDREFSRATVALDGVRHLGSLRDVLWRVP